MTTYFKLLNVCIFMPVYYLNYNNDNNISQLISLLYLLLFLKFCLLFISTPKFIPVSN